MMSLFKVVLPEEGVFELLDHDEIGQKICQNLIKTRLQDQKKQKHRKDS